MCFLPTYKSRQRAFTLLEILIVSVIGLLVAASVMGVLVMGSKMARATSVQNRLGDLARSRLDTLKNRVRSARSFQVVAGGNQLNITNYDGSVMSYRYVDLDNNPNTKNNNQLLYRATPDSPDQRVINYIDRSTSAPIFIRRAGTAEPLAIMLRLGDSPGRPETYNTGPYTQAIDIVTTVSERNT